jgi:proteasome regulatory subunit
MNLSKDVSIETISMKCDNATGADIKAICTEAGMLAIRDGRDCITPSDFEKSIDKVLGDQTIKMRERGVMFA